MDQTKTPLFSRMRDFVNKSRIRLHVPGHKGKKLPNMDEAAEWLESLFLLDWTELEGLDNLHDPHSVIDEAQRLAADCFGAEETCFLVGGSTAGNLAMVLATCQPDDLLIVQRDVHKSILNALMLAGAKAVFVSSSIEEQMTGAVLPEDIEEALQRYPQAKGVVITSPNYYGRVADVRRITEIVHSFGIPVLVDEAHGAHFSFHPKLPCSALSAGADIVVQSTHKMLTSLTMSAMLHIQGDLIDRQRLRQVLGMIQSSSPSYLLMASLDITRSFVAQHGRRLIEQFLKQLADFHRKLKAIPWVGSLPNDADFKDMDIVDKPFAQDPFKLLIYDRTGTLTGFELQRALEKQGCYFEMADPVGVLATFSLIDGKSEMDALLDALSNLKVEYVRDRLNRPLYKIQEETQTNVEGTQTIVGNRISDPVSFGIHKTYGRIRYVDLDDALGHKAAESIIPYPPGIPLLFTGETITRDTLAMIKHWKNAGAYFEGSQDERLNTIAIFASSHHL